MASSHHAHNGHEHEEHVVDPTNANAVPGPSTFYTFPISSDPPPPSTPLIIPTVVDPNSGSRIVPRLFEQCQVDDLITLIASMLDRLITHNDRIPLTPTALTRFHSRAPPSISVRDYLLRIARYTNVEPVCLLILLHYVDKVCTRLPTFTISSLTVHRFVIAAVSVGSKALSDSFCTNGRYARVGGIGVTEMNLLEKEFCEAIDWRLTTTGAVLSHYYTSLVKSHPTYELVPTPVPSRASSPSPSPSPQPMEIDETPRPALKARRSSPALIPTARLTRKRGETNRSNLPSPVRPAVEGTTIGVSHGMDVESEMEEAISHVRGVETEGSEEDESDAQERVSRERAKHWVESNSTSTSEASSAQSSPQHEHQHHHRDSALPTHYHPHQTSFHRPPSPTKSPAKTPQQQQQHQSSHFGTRPSFPSPSTSNTSTSRGRTPRSTTNGASNSMNSPELVAVGGRRGAVD